MRYLFISLLSLIIVACSSSSAPTDGGKDGGSSVQDPNNPDQPISVDEAGVPIVDSGRPENPVPTDRASCIADCEKHHTAAKKLSDSLDKECFTGGTCEPVCNNLGTSGTLHEATAEADGGPACDTKSRQAFPISTYSLACSNCIAETPRCCSLWLDLFGTDKTGASDGQQLAACSSQCYTKFNK